MSIENNLFSFIFLNDLNIENKLEYEILFYYFMKHSENKYIQHSWLII